MSVRLPSRYEDLDDAFRGRLRPNRELLDLVQRAHSSMQISGGIRFLPIYGLSGSGKSCAARGLATHLPECQVIELTRAAIESEAKLLSEISAAQAKYKGRAKRPSLIVAVVDQYEETVAQQSALPSQFVERLSLLDRGALRTTPVLFIWLTTNRQFQHDLSTATTRNSRILVRPDFELPGVDPSEWPDIVEETFSFHNRDQPLADFEILRGDIELVVESTATIGQTIERVGERLASFVSSLDDLSRYQVIMLWPVTDGLRITRVVGFTNARERESKRAVEARDWYAGITTSPVLLGRRLASILTELGKVAKHEGRVTSQYRNVRADVLVERPNSQQGRVLLELKVYSTDGTRPSSIRDAIRGTLRKYAQFAGFLEAD